MMPTDDERREVARKLRASVGKGIPLMLNVAFAAFEFTGCSERTVNADEAALKLADLIDPDPEVSCEAPTSSDNAPTCDRDALLKLADELESEGLDGWAGGPVNVGGYARRIREAVGA